MGRSRLFRSVRVRSEEVTRLWVDPGLRDAVDPPRPELPPTQSPMGSGFMPLYCAAQWIASKVVPNYSTRRTFHAGKPHITNYLRDWHPKISWSLVEQMVLPNWFPGLILSRARSTIHSKTWISTWILAASSIWSPIPVLGRRNRVKGGVIR
jgi:hypothetical protein